MKPHSRSTDDSSLQRVLLDAGLADSSPHTQALQSRVLAEWQQGQSPRRGIGLGWLSARWPAVGLAGVFVACALFGLSAWLAPDPDIQELSSADVLVLISLGEL